MKIKRLFISLFAALGALLFTLMCSNKIDAASINLNKLNEEKYQSAVTVEVECVDFVKVINSIRYASGEHTVEEFKSNASLGYRIEGTSVAINYNGVYTFFAQAGETECAIEVIEIDNIDSTSDEITLTQRTINDNKGRIILDITYLNQESPVKLMKYMDGNRSIDNFKDYGTVLTSEETGDYTYLSFTENGRYTLYIEDECGNKSVKCFEIMNSIVVKDNDEVEVSAANQITYSILISGDQYYIELPKGEYNQGDVVVFTVFNEETNKFEVISSGTYYIYLDNKNIEALDKDCMRIIVDNEVITKYNLGMGDAIVAHFMTRAEAKEIGIEISYFNRNVIFWAGIAIVVVLVLFFVHRSRVKKATIYEEE